MSTSEKKWGDYEPRSEDDVITVYDREKKRVRMAHESGDDAWIEGHFFNLLEVR